MIRPLAPGRVSSINLAEDDIEVRLATQPNELRGAFELVYQSYERAGLTREIDGKLRVTPYQLQECSEIIVAEKDLEIIGTVSYIGDGCLGFPMENVYGEEVEQLRQTGLHLAEVSCLADRRSKVERSMPLLMSMMTLLAQSARHHGVDQLLIAVHPRHVRFYERLMGFSQIGETREYGAVLDRPAVAMAIDLVTPSEHNPGIYAKFFGRPLPVEALCRPSLRSPHFLREMLPLAAQQYRGSKPQSEMSSGPESRYSLQDLLGRPSTSPWELIRKLLTIEADSNEFALGGTELVSC